MSEHKRTWRRDPGLWLSLLLVLLIMALIFSFSAQPVKQSSGTSDGIVARWIRFLLPHFSELPLEQQALIRHRTSFIVRKTAHLLEFAALGFALRLHLGEVSRWQKIRRAGLLSWGIGTLYAASDELHQFFVPGRGPRLYDVGIDSLGVILGILFFALCAHLLQRKK